MGDWVRVPSAEAEFVRLTGELCCVYTRGECRVIVSHEPAGKGDRRLWHLSISCERRHPTWEEIRDTRYELLPDVETMAMLLPPKALYVNIHPHCFHLWEVDDPRDTEARL